jgi:drug/metabolite transporter (DMT)-like permease
LISRYASTFTSVLTAQVLGLLATGVLLVFSGESVPSAQALGFAAIAGAFGVSGLAAFYYALGRGTMGVIAPGAALIGAGGPVLVAIYNGEHVSTARLFGIILALIAVVLISLPGGERTPSERRRVRIELGELPLIVLAGLGFAGFFVFIGHATANGGVLIPLVVVRAVGLALVLSGFVFLLSRMRAAPLRTRVSHLLGLARLRSWPGGRVPLVATFAFAGLGDLGGNLFFVFAQHTDLFSVAVVLSSLYPVITTILAAVLLHERLRRHQIVGVALATLSVVLLSNALG